MQSWPEALARCLLRGVPDAEADLHWGPAGRPDERHRDLLRFARADEQVRAWIVRSWRAAHADVVAVADQAVTDGLTRDSVRMLDLFPLEDVLLALLTDDVDDGQELARKLLGSLHDDHRRRAMQAALANLLGDGTPHSSRTVRVAIVGGHPRDESRLGPRLFGSSPFEVRWKTFEKKPSSGIVRHAVADALEHCDAAIIVTGMASHVLMQFARDYAERRGILWRCIEKATDRQVKASLREMFPDLTSRIW